MLNTSVGMPLRLDQWVSILRTRLAAGPEAESICVLFQTLASSDIKLLHQIQGAASADSGALVWVSNQKE